MTIGINFHQVRHKVGCLGESSIFRSFVYINRSFVYINRSFEYINKSFVLIFRSFVFTLLTEGRNFMSDLVGVYAYCHRIYLLMSSAWSTRKGARHPSPLQPHPHRCDDGQVVADAAGIAHSDVGAARLAPEVLGVVGQEVGIGDDTGWGYAEAAARLE